VNLVAGEAGTRFKSGAIVIELPCVEDSNLVVVPRDVVDGAAG